MKNRSNLSNYKKEIIHLEVLIEDYLELVYKASEQNDYGLSLEKARVKGRFIREAMDRLENWD